MPSEGSFCAEFHCLHHTNEERRAGCEKHTKNAETKNARRARKCALQNESESLTDGNSRRGVSTENLLFQVPNPQVRLRPPRHEANPTPRRAVSRTENKIRKFFDFAFLWPKQALYSFENASKNNTLKKTKFFLKFCVFSCHFCQTRYFSCHLANAKKGT